VDRGFGVARASFDSTNAIEQYENVPDFKMATMMGDIDAAIKIWVTAAVINEVLRVLDDRGELLTKCPPTEGEGLFILCDFAWNALLVVSKLEYSRRAWGNSVRGAEPI